MLPRSFHSESSRFAIHNQKLRGPAEPTVLFRQCETRQWLFPTTGHPKCQENKRRLLNAPAIVMSLFTAHMFHFFSNLRMRKLPSHSVNFPGCIMYDGMHGLLLNFRRGSRKAPPYDVRGCLISNSAATNHESSMKRDPLILGRRGAGPPRRKCPKQ